MNNEVIKAMNKKETKIYKFRNWWGRNGYKVRRVIFFPIWWGICIKNKINAWLDSRNAWSEERAREIFNYYIPRKADWDTGDKCFYFFDNGYGWSMYCTKKYLKRKDRRFWSIYSRWNGGELRSYLIEKFELEGFEKEIGNCHEGWTDITFTMTGK